MSNADYYGMEVGDRVEVDHDFGIVVKIKVLQERGFPDVPYALVSFQGDRISYYCRDLKVVPKPSSLQAAALSYCDAELGRV